MQRRGLVGFADSYSSIWRPIKHPVYDCALAIADGAKLLPSDVIECDRTRLDSGEFWDTVSDGLSS